MRRSPGPYSAEVIVAPHGLSADRVGSAVRADWGVDVTFVEHLEIGDGGWHWRLGDEFGPQWFASAHPVRSADERQRRLAAYDAATRLAAVLPFVVAPVRTRDARLAVDVASGLVLTLVPLLEVFAPGPADDGSRVLAARLLGELHRSHRPRGLPLWRPRIGHGPHDGREALEGCLRSRGWTGGPWSGPAERLLLDVAPVVERALRRFLLLGAAVAGSAERWVVTHGAPYGDRTVSTPDGPRLVGWGRACLAPRERDLGETLAEADGDDPWLAYVEAGGRPERLSKDTMELFALQRHLDEIAAQAARFSRPHGDTADDRRGFGALERELDALASNWG